MKINPDDFWFSVRAMLSTAAAMGAMFWFASSCTPHAQSQDHARAITLTHEPATDTAARRVGEPVTLLLARAALAESDWSAPDRAALLHVLDRRAKRAGISVEQMAQRYVSAYVVGLSHRSAWKLTLAADCSEPEGWQRDVEGDWHGYAKRCARLFEDVRAFQRGELADPCSGATQWGARNLKRDAERAARAVKAGRWLPARCSAPTANAFYREVRR